MKTKVLFNCLAFATLFGITSCGHSDSKNETRPSVIEHKDDGAHKHVYQWPMKCETGKTYQNSGKCPVCKMELKEIHVHHEGDGHQH